MSLGKEVFGHTPDGTPVQLYSLDNENGLQVKICTLGGALVELRAPDRQGDWDNLILGYDSLEEYRGNRGHFGALVGRCANRIGAGRFELDGKTYELARNEKGINHIHGGEHGFGHAVWRDEAISRGAEPMLRLSHFSPDGDQGYPGNLSVTVHYSLSRDNALHIRYSAAIDAPCPVNLTNHAYFNLAGAASGDVLGHELQIFADSFTPSNETKLPTGELRPVAGTPFDFLRPRLIGERIEHDYSQLKMAGGYDHNWVLNNDGQGQSLAARVLEPDSGRVMEMHATQPGVQFYSGNSIVRDLAGRDGAVYQPRWGFCLETQHFPDSPNRPEFPSAVLRPGRRYEHHTSFKFSTL